MESQTYIKNLRISAKKLRFITGEIKKRKPAEVLPYLHYMRKSGAKFFHQAIKSAMANARLKLKTSDDLLRFKLLTVEQGPKFKRFRAGGRGAAKPYVHQTAHIKIILVAEKGADKPTAKEVKEKAKPEIKEAEPKAKKEVKKVKNSKIKK